LQKTEHVVFLDQMEETWSASLIVFVVIEARAADLFSSSRLATKINESVKHSELGAKT
jgi:hypothetical protein